jgi:hypothetical protein
MKSNNDEVLLQGVIVKQMLISRYDVGVTLGTGSLYFDTFRFLRESPYCEG